MSPSISTQDATPALPTPSPSAEDEHDSLVQKLESLSLLSGGVAHDFNNLLMAILGNADLALSATDEPSIELRSYLEEIQGASKRAADLCHRLLIFSGRARFPMRCVEVQPLIEEMAYSLGQAVGDGIRLSYHLPDELPAISGNLDELRGLITLLVRNAREAMPEGAEHGEIRLSLGVTRLDDPDLETAIGAPLRSSRYVWLEVSDDGKGMDDATRLRMFDPFFTTRGAGRGLGLACGLGTVRAHLGRVAVTSQPGQGTRVKVFFPALDSTELV